MLNTQKTGLFIFDNFRIDYSLEKHQIAARKHQELAQKRRNAVQGATLSHTTPAEFNAITNALHSDPDGAWIDSEGFGLDIGFGATPMVGRPVSSVFGSDWIDDQIEARKEMSKRVWARIFRFLFGWAIPAKRPKITVQQFFAQVKGSLKSPETYKEKVLEFLKVASHAKKMGQQALYEEIMRDIQLIKQEAILLASDFKTCITEEQIVKFYKESERGLSLHFIQNYGRVIPLEVCKIKTAADQMYVFDNYVILYYDKDAKVFKETQAEIAKRKDPIIFGVISGVRKLYYVADWIDEFCDLTLKQLIDKFGAEAISANDITVKYNKK